MRQIPTLAEVERRHILNTLRICGNNRTHAAKILGLSIRCLRTKLHEYENEGFFVSNCETHANHKFGETKEAAN